MMSATWVNIMIMRIPMVKFELETYTISSYFTQEMLIKQLTTDKNIIDFYFV
jgi:hypothetical protein